MGVSDFVYLVRKRLGRVRGFAFGNLRPSFCFFCKLVSVTNQPRLWDVELPWYSSSITCWICLHGLEHGLGIHGFCPTWLCQIVEVFESWAKFLEPSGYCIVINCTFTFCTTNVFGSFGTCLFVARVSRDRNSSSRGIYQTCLLVSW